MIFSGQDLYFWYQQAQHMAIASNIPLFDLDWLVQEVTELNSLDLRTKSYLQRVEIKSSVSLVELEQLWQKRVNNNCPVQYLIRKCHWRNFTFKVTPDVLIPRHETELIIDIVSDIVKSNPHLAQGNWLDLGTGSGAIAIGLAAILPSAVIYAVDKSQLAVDIAVENMINLGYEKRITFYCGSWFSPLEKFKFKFRGIVSNPPYIPSELVKNLQPEVVNHEPKMALDGGNDGLKEIRHLVNNAPKFLHNQGILLLEIMQGQSELVKNLLAENGNYTNIKIYQDLAQIDRFILARKTSIISSISGTTEGII